MIPDHSSAAASGVEIVQAGQAETLAEIGVVAEWIGFSSSCIKSGEAWSPTCEEMRDKARSALTRLYALAAQHRQPVKEWHDARIGEVLDDGDGVWRACSGCQESSDGSVSARDYPYNPTFRCQPGSGCRECGGLGVLWDTTDYDEMARYMLLDDPAQHRQQTVVEMREQLDAVERAIRLADTLTSDVPVTAAALGHVKAGYEALAKLRAALSRSQDNEGGGK